LELTMPSRRPFESLDTADITRLLQLAIEAGLLAHDVTPRLLRAYGALAAEFGFELWWRQKARVQVRGACGRLAGSTRTAHRASTH
jgi:hypothetical protein